MSSPLAIVLAVFALISAVLWRSIRAHGRIELRARVMELLARALARERSLPALFARLDTEYPKRKLGEIAAALTEGAPLGDALEEADSPVFPAPWPALVRAVEGDGQLAAVLQDESRVEAHEGRFLEKLLLGLVYPAILAFGVIALNEAHGWASGYNLFSGTSDVEFGVGTVAIVLSLVGAVLALRLTRWPARLPRPWRTSRADRARILRVTSGLLERGLPLHTALRRMVPVATDRVLRAGIQQAAVQAEEGAEPGSVLAFLGAGRHQRARIAGATNASLLDRLRAVAASLESRVRTQQQHILSGLRPAAVVICGVVVLLGYAAFMRHIVGFQTEAMMPW